MKYNLIRNGHFSGSGDHIFTWSDLEKLQDGNTTTSGVTVSGVNDLVVDLSQRIKVDGIRLYASDLTKSNDVYFWYKNEESDAYTQLSTSVGTYYYTTIPAPSAPRYIKVTISGAAMDLYEFSVLNDDYIVAFGKDGTETVNYLENTPVGEEGIPQAVAIYNNSTDPMPADAYSCVEVTGSGYDNYIKISASENGTYYAVEDGAVIEDNNVSSDYIWDMGYYTNSELSGDEVILDLTSEDMGELPLNVNTYSWQVAQNAWDYDPISRTIYAIGADTILKLYKYPIDIGEWEYIGEICPGCSSFTNYATMTYLDGYVYVIINTAGQFGRYDLNGLQNNWTSLSGVGWSFDPTYYGMCSDKNKYIYTIHEYWGNNSNKEFRRYDTTTSGWESLDNGYNNNYDGGPNDNRNACLAYDYERDYIYAEVSSRGSGDYIQRYIVSSNIWNTTWFNIDLYTGVGVDENDHQTHTYYDNYLILAQAHMTDSKVYYYNIVEDIVSYFISTVGGWYDPGYGTIYHNPYILATDHISEMVGSATTIPMAVFASQLDIDRTKMYYLNNSITNGSYTTPIIGLDNKYNSSYVTIEHDGRVSVSASDIDSIEVRSSDTEPLVKDEIMWIVWDTQYRIYKYVVYNGDVSEPYFSLSTDGYKSQAVAVDRRNGNIATVQGSAGYLSTVYIQIYNNSGSLLYNINDDTASSTDQVQFDKSGGIWFSYFGNWLRHYDYELNSLFSDTSVNLYDFAAEMDADGIWYTDVDDDTLIHKNTTGTLLGTVVLNAPRAICGTLDNGCWVIDNVDEKAYRYNSNSALVKTVNIERTATRMSSDMENGFWYINGNYIYHVTSNGVEDVEVYVDQPAWVNGGHNGCVVTSIVHDTIKYIDKDSGSITRSAGPVTYAGPAVMFSFRYEDYVEFQDTVNFLPVSYDPFWGTGGSLEWKTVPKNGYFLPKCKYHQFRITLRDTASESAALKQVILAPAVKTEDIQPGQSKNLYIKTDIPIGADITEYEVKLRSWWGVE